MMFININTCIGILFQIAFITNMHFHTWKIRSFQMQKDTKLFNLRLVHIMLFSFWTFSSLIFGYVIHWAPEGIQIDNRMLLSESSSYIVKDYEKSSKVSDFGPFLKSWSLMYFGFKSAQKEFSQSDLPAICLLRKLYKRIPKFDLYYQSAIIS